MDQQQLNEIIRKHQLWLNDEEGGEIAILRGANLDGADLRGANLRGANLRGANGNLREIKSVFLETWPITYTSEDLQIGCQRHPIANWWGFTDEQIAGMDREALDWWWKWKDTLRKLIEMSPAVPTGREEAAA